LIRQRGTIRVLRRLDELDLTVADIVRWHAANEPQRPAVQFQGRTLTYGELDRESERLARALQGRGCEVGDRIAFLGKNSDWFIVTAIAVSKLRAVFVPINWRLTPPEAAAIVADCSAQLALFESGEKDGAYWSALKDLIPRYCVDSDDSGAGTIWPDGPLPPLESRPGTGADLSALMYTSGTTGKPKGVMLTNRNLLVLNQLRARGLPWDTWKASDVSLLSIPFAHVGGYSQVLRCLFFGALGVVQRQFSIEGTLQAIATQNVSKISLVPAMIQMLVHHPNARSISYERIEVMFYGGSAIEPELLREAKALFQCRFAQGYAMTETAGIVAALSPDDHDVDEGRLLLSAGKPMPGVEIRIVDEANAPVAAGQVGEMVVRSPSVMLGYWGSRGQSPIDSEGWYHTGDAGYIDAQGYLFVSGRIKDMIITGAENVYPAEVENEIYRHPDVAEVAVIGIPDPKWGEAVAAFVVPRTDANIDPADIIAWARERLAHFKAPSVVHVVAELPRNSMGKVVKTELRKPYWEGRRRSIG
jgi:acyl-CoA synthetase (AMP-forming)/AMP-acid ligase II